MFDVQHNRTFRLSVANNRRSKVWDTIDTDINDFLERLSRPVRGTETHAQYMALSKDAQSDKKDVGGFCGGEITGNRQRTKENIEGRDLLTLDFDDIVPGGEETIYSRCRDLGCFVIAHSTRKHSPARPRLRLIAILDRTVTPDEYAALSRKIAEMVAMEACDPASFAPDQMMFWPSCCADIEPIFWYEDKPLLSVDDTLSLYIDWHDMSEWPQSAREQANDRRTVQTKGRQRDPIEKKGVVGEFCRVYDVPRAIDAFLSGIYEPFKGKGDRYTYTGGSTAGGTVLYEDGKFLFSHHATDPAGGKLSNAFDLVRLHKFGDLDAGSEDTVPVNRLPSYAAMRDFARSLPEVQAQHVLEKGDAILDQTGDLDDEDAPEEKQSYKEFFGGLDGKKLTTHVVRDTLDFLGVEFRSNVITGKLEIEKYPKRWSLENAENNMVTHLIDRFHLCEMEYVSEGLLRNQLATISDERRYNPVLEMIQSRPWDGRDWMPVIYSILGVTDPLDKLLIRKWFIQTAGLPDNDPRNPWGADGVLTLQGLQGLGKTSFFREVVPLLLRFMLKQDAMIDVRNKDNVIQNTSMWIVELGELERTTKKDEASLRPFITAVQDQYRAPFARSDKIKPRRTSFCGSVNPEKFLTDEEGNRRFWTVPIKDIDLEHLMILDDNTRQQIWAQAYAAFCADRRFSFRLTIRERADLNARNVQYTKPVDLEMEVLDLCEFGLPEDQWHWLKAGDIADVIRRRTDRYPPLNRLGRALTKIANNDGRIESVLRVGRMYYKLPIILYMTVLESNPANFPTKR